MNTDNSTLASNLRLLLKHRGISKSELAREMEVTRQTVQAWLKNGAVSRDNLMKLSQYFEISVSALVGDDVENYSSREAEILKTEIKELIDVVPSSHIVLLQYLKKMLN